MASRYEGLTKIGYWRPRDEDLPGSISAEIWAKEFGEPWPGDFVDESWDPGDREQVAGYLDAGDCHEACKGYSPCRLCDLRKNGTSCLTDGTYVWPSGLSHYVREHAVRPPDDFIRHALQRRRQ